MKISEYVDFLADVEVPASMDYVNQLGGVILVGFFFIMFINSVNYLWSLLLRVLLRNLGV